MHDNALIATVTMVVSLLFVASVSAVIAHRIRFPYTVGLVVVGGLVAVMADFVPPAAQALEGLRLGPEMILFLFIPPLIFESAWSMDMRLLRHNLWPILMLAGPGLLISAALVGGLLWLLTPLPLAATLIFGCLISATDPVAVIALFRDLGAPRRLTMLMEGESVFNDATAIVTFQILLAVVAAGAFGAMTVIGGVLDFAVVFLGGLAVGLVIGRVMVWAIPLVGGMSLVHVTLSLVAAYGAFLIADHLLHVSGVIAVLASGLTIGHAAPARFSARVRAYLEMFWEDAAFMANSLIFLLLGLSQKDFLSRLLAEPGEMLWIIAVALAVVLVVRFGVVFGLVPLINRADPANPPVSMGARAVLAWGALRGAVAVALALSLPESFPERALIIDLTFAVTLFTLLINGTSIGWLMRVTGLDKPSALEAFQLAFARHEAEAAAMDNLRDAAAQSSDAAFYELALSRQNARLQGTAEQLESARAALGDSAQDRTALLWRQVAAVQSSVYHQRVLDGLLSPQSRDGFEDGLEPGAVLYPPVDDPLPSERHGPRDGLVDLFARASGAAPALQRKGDYVRAEELGAVIAASRQVLEDLDGLAAVSDPDPQGLGACRQHFRDRLTRAEGRYSPLLARHDRAAEALEARRVARITQNARETRLRYLAAQGEISDALSRQAAEDHGPG